MSYINPSGTFRNQTFGGPVTVLQPATGSVVKLLGTVRDVYFSNPTTIAALSLWLPPINKHEVFKLLSASAITALTVLDRLGNAVPNMPTSLAAGQSIELRYMGKTLGWVRWR